MTSGYSRNIKYLGLRLPPTRKEKNTELASTLSNLTTTLTIKHIFSNFYFRKQEEMLTSKNFHAWKLSNKALSEKPYFTPPIVQKQASSSNYSF